MSVEIIAQSEPWKKDICLQWGEQRGCHATYDRYCSTIWTASWAALRECWGLRGHSLTKANKGLLELLC